MRGRCVKEAGALIPDTEAGHRAAAVQRAERRVRTLQEFTEIGMDMARVLHEQVLAKATEPKKASAGDHPQPQPQPQPQP